MNIINLLIANLWFMVGIFKEDTIYFYLGLVLGLIYGCIYIIGNFKEFGK